MKSKIIVWIIQVFCILVFSSYCLAKQQPKEAVQTAQTEGPQSGDHTAGPSLHLGANSATALTTTAHSKPHVSTETFQVEPSTGTATLNIPIEVPGGRKGIQPSISLLYNSSSPNGILGVGWTLDFGSIQRSTKPGVPEYNDDLDTFILTQAGSPQELEKIAYYGGTTEYRTKIEGAFFKVIYNGFGWIITDKKGTQYFFGYNNENSRQYNPENPGSPFRWCLDRVEDLNGNYTTLTYFKNQNQIYPEQIDYTGNTLTGAATFADIQFTYGDRTDISTSFRAGFAVTTAKQLLSIDVNADGNLQRSYELEYDVSPSTGRSVLTSITQHGRDGSVLPSTDFGYSFKEAAFDSVLIWPGIAYDSPADQSYGNIRNNDGDAHWTNIDLLDINGDGLPDRMMHRYNSDPFWEVQLNNGSGFDSVITWGGVEFAGSGWSQVWYYETFGAASKIDKVDMFDISGDGLVDRVIDRYEYDGIWQVQSNNGHGFDSLIVWPGIGYDSPAEQSYGKIRHTDSDARWTNIDLFDINGDGLADRIMHRYNSDPFWEIQLNNGSGFDSIATWPGVAFAGEAYGQIRYFVIEGAATRIDRVDVADVNGDGLVDRVIDRTDGDGLWEVQYNNGRGFEPVASITGIVPGSYGRIRSTDGDARWTNIDLFDINGDGLPDRIMHEHLSDDYWEVQLNNGHGFDPVTVWSGVALSDAWSQIRYYHIFGAATHIDKVHIADINGDGLVDRVINQHDYDSLWEVQLNSLHAPDLLVSIDNGVGGHTDISYTPSTRYDNTGEDDDPDLPFPIQVVSSVTLTDDFTGHSFVTTYDYRGGRWQGYPDKEFRGFGWVKTVDPEGNYSETEFMQDDICKGRVKEQGSYGGSDRRFTKTENVWVHQEIHPGVNYVYLAEADNYTFNPLDADSCTVLLLHCDGQAGSGLFVDESPFSHTVSTHGNAQLDTAESRFGGASGLFDLTGDYLTISDSDNFAFDGDFTIDGWVRLRSFPGVGTNRGIFDTSEGNYKGVKLTLDNTAIYASLGNASGDGWEKQINFSYSGLVSLNTWYHFAVVRSGNQFTLYWNGVSRASDSVTVSTPDHDGDCSVATAYVADPRFQSTDGWIDEFRISKGVARWTSDFTAPTQPHSSGIKYYISSIDYNASGQTLRIVYGNGTVTDYEYDGNTLRLTHLATTGSTGEVIQDLTYTYDSVGNITRITDYVDSATQDFTYDDLNRLDTAYNPIYGSKDYAYDEIGNLTRKDGLDYTYGEGSAGPHALTSGTDGSVFSYDANGNMVSMARNRTQLTTYQYDFENRLNHVVRNYRTLATFEYDGDGGRTKKTSYFYRWTPGHPRIPKKRIDPDGLGPDVPSTGPIVSNTSDSRILSPEDSAGGASALSGWKTTTVTTVYVGSLFEETDGVSTSHIFLGSQRIASVVNGQPHYFHKNHLGSTDKITDDSGAQLVHYEYAPYGTIVLTQGQDATGYKFTDKEYDSEVGLYYYGARYYNPVIGRFITPDPIIKRPFDPQDLARYAYCRSNPVNLMDPKGMSWRRKVFGNINDFFGRLFGWLETVTGTSWSVNVNFRYSVSTDAPVRTAGKAAVTAAEVALTAPWGVLKGTYDWLFQRFALFDLVSRSGISDLSGYRNVFVTGVLTASEDQAVSTALQVPSLRKAYMSGNRETLVALNPSSGAAADIVESILSKILPFVGVKDRQLAGVLRDMGRAGRDISAFFHSEGAIIGANSLIGLGLAGWRLPENSSVTFIGPPITRLRAEFSYFVAGGKGPVGWRATWKDLVTASALPNPPHIMVGVISTLIYGLEPHSVSSYYKSPAD